MTAAQAFLLALVQGITEFLPISSSAHLILIPYLFGWQDQGLLFDIITNAGTLTAVVFYFRRDLLEMATEAPEAVRRTVRAQGPPHLLAALAVATLPVIVAGALLFRFIATDARNPMLIAVTSIVFGLLLGWADRRAPQTRRLSSLTWRDVWVVGLAEALALLPGTSRSGVTITAALLLGYRREDAARFSFLLSIPVSVAALALDLKELVVGGPPDGGWLPLLIGFAASAVSAYLVIDWLLDWIRRQDLSLFVAYRIALGCLILVLAYFS